MTYSTLRLAFACLALALLPLISRASVELLAPAPLDEFLRRHLDLPATLADDTARAGLMRRVRREIADLLATEGYFSPTIELRPETSSGLTIRITPGPQTQVSEVDIQFRGHLAGETPVLAERRTALRAAWGLPPGSPFRSPDWEEAKTALLAATAEVDYAAARLLASRAEVDPEHARARLEVTLDSGPAWRFGPLSIEGLKRYEAIRVTELAPFSPGDAYRRQPLLDFQSRLQNTPWFHSVAVEAVPPPGTEEETTVPVQVTLAEAPAKRLGLGAGYSSNTRARGELNLRHHDFLGRAWEFSGGLRLEQKRQTTFADLALLPDERGYRLSFGSRLETSDIQGLRTARQILGVTRSRTAGRIETRLGLEWQHENSRADRDRKETDQALMLDWRWTRRAIDDGLDPRQGNVIEMRLGGASRRLLSDRDFLRAHWRGQHWWPVSWLGARDSVSLRGEVGMTVAASRSGIPQDYLFRAGGAQSVRGHAYQSLGVRDGRAVVGGRTLATGSAEYTHWLKGEGGKAGLWGIAAFVDAGNAADDWHTFDTAVGVGTGVRWKSPAGPLALDLARGLARNGRDAQWQLHFSLMVAF